MKRRKFLKTTTVAGLGLAASPRLSWLRSPNDTVVVAVMGLNGRGTVLARTFASWRTADVAYVCDVDSVVLAKGVAAVAGVRRGARGVQGLGDFRKALDDKAVDALVIAAPDHCHTPAALLALQAWRHAYVAMPCGHHARDRALAGQRRPEHQRVV